MKPIPVIMLAFAVMAATAMLSGGEGVYKIKPPTVTDQKIRKWPMSDAQAFCVCTSAPWGGGKKEFILSEQGTSPHSIMFHLAFVDDRTYAEAERLTGMPVYVKGVVAQRGTGFHEDTWMIVETIEAPK